jgi:hypothetical protein
MHDGLLLAQWHAPRTATCQTCTTWTSTTGAGSVANYQQSKLEPIRSEGSGALRDQVHDGGRCTDKARSALLAVRITGGSPARHAAPATSER